MYLEIVSPEAVLFRNEVDSVAVPGINGEFQMLSDHASIVSSLTKGSIKIHTHSQQNIAFDDLHGSLKKHSEDNKIITLDINSGTLELKNNKAIILVD